jgi:GTPase SAR1 family protein
MVLGLATYTWNSQQGPVLESKHPETLSLSDSAITKLFMVQSMNEDDKTKSDFTETTIGDRTYWSYCDLTRRLQGGHEMALLVLDPSEIMAPLKVKTRFLNFARLYFKHEAKERKTFFKNSTGLFFEAQSKRKVLLVGRAATGKSSIKQVIFDGKNPYNLLFNPLEPTLDLEPSLHSWLDLSVGVFDSSGQEFDTLLKDETLQNLAFENSSIVIHVIDISRWMDHKAEVVGDVIKVDALLRFKGISSQQVLFINKIDLVNDLQRQKLLDEIVHEVQLDSKVEIYPTSIHPGMIYSTYAAFSKLLGKLSKNAQLLQDVLESAIHSEKKAGIFITNAENAVIAQSTTKDFDHEMINCTHEIIGHINQILDHVHEGDGIATASMRSRSGIRISAWYLDLIEFDMATLIIASTGMLDSRITGLLEKIKEELRSRLYHDR